MPSLTPSNFDYLKQLKKNNNRDWFLKNKGTYDKERERVIAFAEALLNEMQKHDNIETHSGKKSLHRIYRDIRFSKDKTPYKSNWSGGFRRATKLLRGGYYFHIEPGNTFVGGGFWGPNPEDMKRIREDIASNDKDLRKIVTSKSFVETFGELKGERVKTAPKGYPKDHPAIDLLRHKQYIIGKSFTDKEALSPDFFLKANGVFKKMRPFFDYMSEVLTTDSNGAPLY